MSKKLNPIIQILNQKLGETGLRITRVVKEPPEGADCKDCQHFGKVRGPTQSHCFMFYYRVDLQPCEAFKRNDPATEVC